MPENRNDLNEILAAVPSAVIGRDMSGFARDSFGASMARYDEETRGIWEALQAYVNTRPEEREKTVRLAAKTLVAAVQEDLNAPGRYKGLNAKNLRQDDYRMIVVTYLTPELDRLALPISGDLQQAIHDEWVAVWPKQDYRFITLDKIEQGFRKKWYQCYITQAVCEYLGKADDGEELTAFRRFRDGYLRACPDGDALIREYYETAPAIVLRMELSAGRETRYKALWNDFLMPCLRDIEKGENEACKARYMRMVRELEKEYLPCGQAPFAI